MSGLITVTHNGKVCCASDNPNHFCDRCRAAYNREQATDPFFGDSGVVLNAEQRRDTMPVANYDYAAWSRGADSPQAIFQNAEQQMIQQRLSAPGLGTAPTLDDLLRLNSLENQTSRVVSNERLRPVEMSFIDAPQYDSPTHNSASDSLFRGLRWAAH